jgi:hypothetical protein
MNGTLKRITTILLLTASGAYAANGSEGDGGSLLVFIFLAFGGMILIFQMVPGSMLFFSMIKGLFSPGKKVSLNTGDNGEKG